MTGRPFGRFGSVSQSRLVTHLQRGGVKFGVDRPIVALRCPVDRKTRGRQGLNGGRLVWSSSPNRARCELRCMRILHSWLAFEKRLMTRISWGLLGNRFSAQATPEPSLLDRQKPHPCDRTQGTTTATAATSRENEYQPHICARCSESTATACRDSPLGCFLLRLIHLPFTHPGPVIHKPTTSAHYPDCRGSTKPSFTDHTPPSSSSRFVSRGMACPAVPPLPSDFAK